MKKGGVWVAKRCDISLRFKNGERHVGMKKRIQSLKEQSD